MLLRLKHYTVLLAYPPELGYLETFLARTESGSELSAIADARRQAVEANAAIYKDTVDKFKPGEFRFKPGEFRVLAVFAGAHDDIRPPETIS